MAELDAPDQPDRGQWAADVVLNSGETAHIRPITASDAAALAAFHRRQSSSSIYLRYFSPKPELSGRELDHFTRVDFAGRVALIVERGDRLVAWASYERWPARDDAEAAFMVDDDEQGQGIATLLLEHLASIARSNGIRRFTAEVLAENRPMLAVFSRAGLPVQRHFESGVVDVELPLDDTIAFVDSVERREQRADSRAMARLLVPRTIAVVGASERAGTIGHALWDHVRTGAVGPVYAVNPNRSTVDGERSWPSVRSIPDDVWLAVIAVPADQLTAVVHDCIAARVRGIVIITTVDGTDVDVEGLVAEARRHGVRLIGPSSMGIASPRPEIGLQAALVPVTLPSGSVAISLQSGSLGASVLRLADRLSIGVSWFVSLGDRSDVSGNDLLQFWEDDEATGVIAMYTETFGNPRKFARIARRVSRQRPIIAVRSGTAAFDHGATALYQQAGLIEVPTVTAMLDTARVLATQPVMAGPNVAVLSNSRSPSTLAHAALSAAGLTAVPAPITLDWRSSSAEYGVALRAALADERVDAVMVVHAPPVEALVAAPVDVIDDAAAASSKPVVAVLLGGGDGPIRPGSPVPGFAFPEPAAAVLGRSYAYGRWLATEAAGFVEPVVDIDRALANLVVGGSIAHGSASVLGAEAVAELLGAYRIPTPTVRQVDASEATSAARDVGYPVAVKALRRRIGRSVEAGIALDLADPGAVVEATRVMERALGADAEEVLVQAMTRPGLDVRIRCTRNDRLSPVIAVGVGGNQAGDLIDEEPSRLAPLSSAAASALVDGSHIGPALRDAGMDAEPLVDVLVRVAQLSVDHPAVVELDLNPTIVTIDGCCVTDAVVVVRAPTHAELPLRRLE